MTRKNGTILAFAAAALAALAIALASPAATLASGAAQIKQGSISPASAFTFPSTKVCVSGHKLTFRMRKLSHVTWKTVTILVNGKHFKTVKLSRNPKPVTLTGLPDGKFVLRVTATTTKARHVSASRTYNSCAPAANTLTVSRTGSGAGSVSGTGISCPGTCSHDYAAGAIVVLYQVPAAGSIFTGWSGAAGVGCSVAPFCVVYMTKAKAVAATFQAVSPSSLAVHSWGSGSGAVTSTDTDINCPGTCSASYAYGTQVTLDAAAASGSTFVGWSGGGCTGTGTCAVTVDSALDVTATFTKAPVASETPGSYSADAPGHYGGLTFYVSPDGGSIENVALSSNSFSCTPTPPSSLSPTLNVAAIPIANDGSFSSTTTQAGLVGNDPATFTYTFNGQFSAPSTLGGTWREDVTYSDSGTTYNCSSNNQSFAAALTSQGSPQNTATAAPGSYAADAPGHYGGLTFYVSPDGGSIENVALDSNSFACAPTTGNLYPTLNIASIPLNTDGSFAGTTTQAGLVGNDPATFTYTYDGYVHGPNTSGKTRLNGMWREDVTYTDSGTTYHCSSNNQPFAATPTSQGSSQNTATAAPGSYAADAPGHYGGLTFYVSPDGGSIENVALNSNSFACAPTTSNLYPTLNVASIPIDDDGSFSSTSTQTGLVGHDPAAFTYTLAGYVHGPDTAGKTRINGIWREDVTYVDSGTTYNCSSDNQPYAAALTSQGSPQNSATAAPGSYAADAPGNYGGLTFSVSPDGSSIKTVALRSNSFSCTPTASNLYPTLNIASIPIDGGGSFSSTTTQTGLVGNDPATFTYTFTGYVHGPNSAGKTRINGVWREDVTYADSGTAYYCSSNNEPFAAAHQ